MSERPQKITIASLTWSIDFNPKLAANVFGMCDSAKLLIQISSTPDQEEVRRSTLLHEIMHALFFTYGFKPTFDEKTETEEEIVSFMSSALYDTLIKNPDVASYIFKG
jgi:hypothetical protein